jgi:hypothetical protein
LAQGSVKKIAATLCAVSLLFLLGCSYNYDFTLDSAGKDGANPIDHSEPGFFILKYQAYQGTNCIGGTLNEIAIRNTSAQPLTVESISLIQNFRGANITADNAPIHYLGLPMSSITTPTVPTTNRNVIEPGEWMCFAIPTKEIQQFEVGDKMTVQFAISMSSGSQHYQNRISLTKTLTKTRNTTMP